MIDQWPGRWTVIAPVLRMPGGRPHAAWTIMLSLPPQLGSGVELGGIDLDAIPGTNFYDNGTVETPPLRLTGHYDGRVLTLTEPPVRDDPPREETGFPTACTDPDGDPFTQDQLQAAIGYAHAQPEYGTCWVSQDGQVLNVTFTADLDRHRQAIRTVYPGPLCLDHATYPATELESIRNRIGDDRADLAAAGITWLGTSDSVGRVRINVVAAGPEERAWLQHRYGPALEVRSWLQPVDV